MVRGIAKYQEAMETQPRVAVTMQILDSDEEELDDPSLWDFDPN